MKVSNRNFYQVMEGAEWRVQLHYEVFGVELGWLSTPCLTGLFYGADTSTLLCPGPGEHGRE